MFYTKNSPKQILIPALEERLHYLSCLCLEEDVAKLLPYEEKLKESAAKKCGKAFTLQSCARQLVNLMYFP